MKGAKFLLFCGSRIKIFTEDLRKRGIPQEGLNKHKLWVSEAKEKEKVRLSERKEYLAIAEEVLASEKVVILVTSN